MADTLVDKLKATGLGLVGFSVGVGVAAGLIVNEIFQGAKKGVYDLLGVDYLTIKDEYATHILRNKSPYNQKEFADI